MFGDIWNFLSFGPNAGKYGSEKLRIQIVLRSVLGIAINELQRSSLDKPKKDKDYFIW